MALIEVADSDDFSAFESLEDINGDSTEKSSTDGFTLLEIESVHVVGSYPFYPPFTITPRPMITSASFGGNRGYEEPTTFMRLTRGSEYPRINASLYGPDDQPLALGDYGYEEIRFHVACADGTFVVRDVTVEDVDEAQVYFDWPAGMPVGTHAGRFTLVTLETVEDEEVETALLSVPTWPLTIEVAE